MAKLSSLRRAVGGPSAPAPCYVRVTNADRHGYIEFQFSIGDPALYLEMTLPPAAFAEFCAAHRVSHLDEAAARAVDRQVLRWRDGSVAEDRA